MHNIKQQPASASELIAREIIEPHSPANATVIWMHGLGANGHDLTPIVPQLKIPAHMTLRFIFPHAPEIPVSINAGLIMPAWYDIVHADIQREINSTQLLNSAAAINALVEHEIKLGIPSQRIILAGFSQGGAVAYQTALSYDRPLGGLLILSGYIANNQNIPMHTVNQALPIQVFHGEYDPVVPIALAADAVKFLKQQGYQPSFETFPIEHCINDQETLLISQWLQNLLT